MRFAVQPGLHRVGAEDGGAVLWSRSQNQYLEISKEAAYTLDAAQRIDGHSLDELRAAVFSLPEPVNAEAFAAALRDLEVHNLLILFDEREGLSPPARLVLQAAVANLAARMLLAVTGRRLLARLATVSPSPADRHDAGDEAAIWAGIVGEEAIAALRRARIIPGVDLSCLPAAVGLWILFRWRGHHPKLRLGAITKPFTAHAWIELNGKRVDPGSTTFPGTAF